MPSNYRLQLEDWLKTLDVKADTVYDIGGKQKPVKGRTKSWEVNEYKILDLPEFDVQEEMSTSQVVRYEKADLIFCLEVFEYLIYPSGAMYNISYLLNEGGTAYISFAFIYPHFYANCSI